MSQMASKNRNVGGGLRPRNTVSLFGLVTVMMFTLLFATSLLEGASRVVGAINDNEALQEAIFIQAFTVLIAGALSIITFAFRPPKTSLFFIYTIAFFLLSTLLLAHFLFSTPAEPNAWNTIPFELGRSMVLGCFMLGLFNLAGAPQISTASLAHLAKASMVICVLLVGVAILQRMELLPNFYFQWYNGRHLARPAGGFEHPHYFAMLLVIGCAVAIVSLENRLVSKRLAIPIVFIFLAGIWVSTSRVGLVSALAFFLSYAFLRLDLKRVILGSTLTLFLILLASLLVLLNWDSISQWQVMRSIEVFLSAFIDSFSADSSGGQFLRGRDQRWAHEISLITATPQTFSIGYGHQPFVSHNLFLRQLQASGTLGTICYLTMLATASSFWISRLARSDRAPIYAVLFSILVGSITFPVLVSTAIVSGLFVLAAMSIGLSHIRGTRWRAPSSATR